MALKLEVSVVRTVVGALLEALVRFFELRPTLLTVLPGSSKIASCDLALSVAMPA